MFARIAVPLAVVSLSCCERPPGVRTVYSVSGTVSGASAAAVTVNLTGAKSASTTTDASGRYVFDGLPSGTYSVTPSLAGYIFSPPTATVVTAEDSNIAVQDFAGTICDTWLPVESGTAIDLEAIWGSGPDDIWAVGDSTMLHWNGSAWSSVATPLNDGTSHHWNAVWGSGANDVWAVGGYQGIILHWNGGAWSTVEESGTPGSIESVWGTGPNDVWAVGWELTTTLERPRR